MSGPEYGRLRFVAGAVFAAAGIGYFFQSLGAWTVNLVFLWPLVLIMFGTSVLLGRAQRIQVEETRTGQLTLAEERVRIARELHDIVAHSVTLMTVQVAAARRVAKTKPEEADRALGRGRGHRAQQPDRVAAAARHPAVRRRIHRSGQPGTR